MKPWFVLTLVCLAGCASTSDVFTSSIDESQYIGRPVGEVSQCLQLRLSEAPITTPDGKATFLIKNQFGATLAMMSLSPNGSGTRIDIRRSQSLAVTGQWKKCQ